MLKYKSCCCRNADLILKRYKNLKNHSANGAQYKYKESCIEVFSFEVKFVGLAYSRLCRPWAYYIDVCRCGGYFLFGA